MSTEQMIKAKETYYRGYHFRSRLEARWAVFFDYLGVKFEYEPERFELPSGDTYLPDFRVKCYGTRGSTSDNPFDLYIEVKGEMKEEDAGKIWEFATGTRNKDEFYSIDYYNYTSRNPILVVGNIPEQRHADDPWVDYYAVEKEEWYKKYPVSYYNYELIDGDWFGAAPAAIDGKLYLWGDEGHYIHDVDIVEEAYDAARQERFEKWRQTPKNLKKYVPQKADGRFNEKTKCSVKRFIPSIPRYYKEKKFHNLLAASWAAFLENLNIEYQYTYPNEKEPFTPCFYLPTENTWIDTNNYQGCNMTDYEEFGKKLKGTELFLLCNNEPEFATVHSFLNGTGTGIVVYSYTQPCYEVKDTNTEDVLPLCISKTDPVPSLYFNHNVWKPERITLTQLKNTSSLVKKLCFGV